MTERKIHRLSEQERDGHIQTIKSAIQGVVGTFIQDHPSVIDLTKNEDSRDWFRDWGNLTFTTLSVADFIGVAQPGAEEGSYEMVLPDQHGDLFSALEPLVIAAIENEGFTTSKEGLHAQHFRINFI